jgi:hypothetical protein
MAAILAQIYLTITHLTDMFRLFRTLHTVTIPPFPGLGFAIAAFHLAVPPHIIATCLSPSGLDLIQKRLQDLKRVQILTMKKQAAVLVPFCIVDGEPSVLFTLRSAQLKNHSGEVRFVL